MFCSIVLPLYLLDMLQRFVGSSKLLSLAVSMLVKRQVSEREKMYEISSSSPEDDVKVESCGESVEKSSQEPNVSSLFSEGSFSLNIEQEVVNQNTNEHPGGSSDDSTQANLTLSRSDTFNSVPNRGIRKKARQNQWSQLSLKSFFQRRPRDLDCGDNSVTGISLEQANVSESDHSLDENFMVNPEQSRLNDCTSTQDESHLNASCTSEREKSNDALVEWQRIQQLMQSSIPLCKGHREPCVSRVVKKAGPNSGRRFYVCARAEGPASNPESNCGYFKWAASKPKGKR